MLRRIRRGSGRGSTLHVSHRGGGFTAVVTAGLSAASSAVRSKVRAKSRSDNHRWYCTAFNRVLPSSPPLSDCISSELCWVADDFQWHCFATLPASGDARAHCLLHTGIASASAPAEHRLVMRTMPYLSMALLPTMYINDADWLSERTFSAYLTARSCLNRLNGCSGCSSLLPASAGGSFNRDSCQIIPF